MLLQRPCFPILSIINISQTKQQAIKTSNSYSLSILHIIIRASASPRKSSTKMAPSSRNVLTATLILASTAYALPQQNVDSSMPVLSQPTATASVEVWQSSSASANEWWTPEATQSEWDWKTWSASQVQSTPVAVVATSPVAQALAASESSTPYSNPFTIYTTMTNSLGVITGMPAVVTAQPSEAAVVSVCSGCSSVMSDQASWSSMVASLYTTSTPVAAAVASSTMSSDVEALSAESSAASSASSSVTFSQSTGAASRSIAISGSAVLAIIGAIAALV